MKTTLHVRSDTNAALSVVSGDYEIVQPREVLEFYRELMKLYGYTLMMVRKTMLDM